MDSLTHSFYFSGFNKDEGSLFIFGTVANLTEAAVEENPYGSFVYSATYLGTTLRVAHLLDYNLESGVAFCCCFFVSRKDIYMYFRI